MRFSSGCSGGRGCGSDFYFLGVWDFSTGFCKEGSIVRGFIDSYFMFFCSFCLCRVWSRLITVWWTVFSFSVFSFRSSSRMAVRTLFWGYRELSVKYYVCKVRRYIMR